VPPVQAAAILLPILVAMDIVSLWTWWGYRDLTTLKIMVPGGAIGVGIGWLTATIVTEGEIKLIVGLVALAFVLRYAWQRFEARRKVRKVEPARHRPVAGVFWGTIAGFTSFVSHAGGPPYQFYTLPLGQDPKLYTGTNVRFFAIINALKLLPYFMLGQFDTSNLEISASLVPVAIVSPLAGAWLVRRMQPTVFYPFMYAMIFLTALKLISDGLSDVMVW
jgi:uncharacterized membrane protein YfcA